MSSGLTRQDIKTILQVLKKSPEVETAVLYGSRALGTYQRGSDIDIALKGKKLTSSICSHIHFELEEETLLPYFFDITDYQSIKNEKLKEHIDRVGKVIYGIDYGKLKTDKSKLPKEWIETTLGLLPADWVPIQAQNYCDKVADGTHNSPKKTQVGKLLITSKNIKDSRLDINSAYHISINDFVEVNKRSKVDRWDVLLSMIGTVGEICIIKQEPDFAIKNVGLFKCGNETRAKWLYYFLKSKIGCHYILSRLSGTTQKYITLGELRKLPIPNPPLPEQKAITGVLSSLDAKIELLREQNQTLEKTAQTLFKQWFVDFNFPGENGKPYKDNGGEMVGSELGEIPKNWSVGELKDLTKVINGRAYKNTEFKLEGTPIVRIQNLTGKGQTVYSDIELPEDKYISSGDLIYAWSATFGPYIWRGEKSIYHYHIWKLECHPYYKYFLYLYLRRSSNNLKNQGTGSIFTHITKSLMESQEVIIPEKKILLHWHSVVSTLFDKIMANTEQIQALIKTRDILLPKLMSGQIRIND